MWRSIGKWLLRKVVEEILEELVERSGAPGKMPRR